jgi:hypothetical protein
MSPDLVKRLCCVHCCRALAEVLVAHASETGCVDPDDDEWSFEENEDGFPGTMATTMLEEAAVVLRWMGACKHGPLAKTEATS